MNLPVNLAELANSLNDVANFCSTPSDPFIKLNQDTGDWSLGSDEEILDPDSIFIVDPDSIKRGFSAFNSEGKRVGEEMRSLSEEPLLKSDLEPVGADWIEQVGFTLHCVDGDDNGVKGQLYQRSIGGRMAIGGLIKDIAERVSKNEPFIPAIKLEWKWFYPKKKVYGKKRQPVFKIIEWLDMDVLESAISARTTQAEPATVEPDEDETEPTVIVKKPKRRHKAAAKAQSKK